jgi:hypothetical protein
MADDEAGTGSLADRVLLEKLAAVEHERWSHWQRYLHEQCIEGEDGSLTIPASLATRWAKQMETAYDALSEREKESDREQVREYLAVIARHLESESSARR